MSIVNGGLDAAVIGAGARAPRGGLVKRTFDVCAALAILLAAGPLMAFIALAIYGLEGGPVLFGHNRIGYGGRRFKCLKFRSMVPNAGAMLEQYFATNPSARAEWDATQKLRDDPRVTKLGRFLRVTSLDELPQLINVLRGDMSLVGPRPVVQDELARYGTDASFYTVARPGITGLWQVSGRSDVDYGSRVRLDTQYVQKWSLLGDFHILFRTIGVVFSRSGSF